MPTLPEQGVKRLSMSISGTACWRPPARSAEIVARYNTVFNEILTHASVREQLTKQGLQASGGTPRDFADMIAKRSPRWPKVVKEAGIAPE